MKNSLLASVLLLLCPVTLLAQREKQETKVFFASELGSKATETNTTYLDLIRKVIPDLQIDANDASVAMGHKTIPFKHLSEDTPAETLEGAIKLETFQSRWIKSDGRRVLLLDIFRLRKRTRALLTKERQIYSLHSRSNRRCGCWM